MIRPRLIRARASIAWRNLVQLGRALAGVEDPHRPDVLHPPLDIESSHPCLLCRCPGQNPERPDPNIDHDPECPWLLAMCLDCGGTGWCSRCGGDGCDPVPPRSES